MPAKHIIDNRAKLLVTEWEGDALDTELIETIVKYQENIQLNPDYLEYNEIVDFSKVESIKVTPEGILNVGKIASKTDESKKGTKLALIVTSSLAFNLARMYTTYRKLDEKVNKEIRIFKNRDDAFEWVKINSKELSSGAKKYS